MISKISNYKCNFHLVIKIIFFALCLFLSSAHWVYGQSKLDSVAYRVYPLRISHDFKLNGQLTNSLWNKAQAVYISHEFTPNDQIPAPVQTKVKVLYSDNYLYFGFWARDPHPAKMRAHITNRDGIGSEDFVLVILDPFNTNRHAYELAVNPRGVQLDAKATPYGESFNFNMLWYSKAAINDSGYTAVMKIPFSSLHFPKAAIQNWGINFMRIYPRNQRYQFSWANLSIGNPCQLCQSGRLVGITGIEHSNPVNIIPYALGFKSAVLNDPGDPASGLDSQPLDGRIGGTIIYSPTSTSTIDATINPDFSQVETDATKIAVNNTFALQYPEKRPFFLKKLNLFQDGYNLFYSRTINRPWAAGKYTQTAHKYSIGFLTAYDRNTLFIVPGLLGSNTVKSNINAYDNILRGKVNIGSQSHVGGLLTTRNEAGGYNYVGSIDWNFFLGHHFYFTGTAAWSKTKELSDTTLFNDSRRFGYSRFDAAFNGEQFNGTFFSAKLRRDSKYYNFSFEYRSLSPTFQAQNGFITKTNRRQLNFQQYIAYYPNTGWLSRGLVSVSGTWRYDFSNMLRKRKIYLNLQNRFAGQTFLVLQYLPLNDEYFRGRFFTEVHSAAVLIRSRPSHYFSFHTSFEFGRFIYRSLHPKMGHGYNISAGATLKPMPRFKLNLSYNYSTLSSLDDQTQFYSGSISRLEGHFNFSRHLHFRLIAQYNSFSKQIQVYPLLYYKLNPFTKIYLGMTDNLQHVNQFGPPHINGYRQINREFFIKVQYLIRK